MITAEDFLFMYATLGSAVLAGIVNSIWCKSKVDFLKKPIDAGKNFFDGRRIFGDNKTWKGLVGYVFFNIIAAVVLAGFLIYVALTNIVIFIRIILITFFLISVWAR